MLYRLKQLERGFVLDGVCLSHLANDETDRTFPSLNIGRLIPSRYQLTDDRFSSGIPQYNAQFDRSTASYFKRRGLPKFVTTCNVDDKVFI